MKALTKEQVILWCEHKSVTVSNVGLGYLYFREHRRCIAIELPQKPSQVVALANSLLPYSETNRFEGALLWIRLWGVWSELVEQVGFRVLDCVRQIHHETATLAEAPGYFFEDQELVDLQVCLVQPLLVGWDAFLVPESADYIVETSHDETTIIMSRTPEVHERLLAELRPWNPRDETESYFRRLGVPSGH
jgi:hypothetical protein